MKSHRQKMGQQAWQQIARCALSDTHKSLYERQHDWLMNCLQRNADSEYGRRYDFKHMSSVDNFCRSVPLNDYETMKPSIDRIAQGEADVLFAGMPVAFEQTGGSVSGGKLIPYSASSLLDFSRAVCPWLGDLATRYILNDHAPERAPGRAYWAISPATRPSHTTPGGIPIGLPDAAYLGEDLLCAFAALSAVSPEVATMTDIRQWQKHTWMALLQCPDLVLISVWSPTFMLALLDALPALADELYFQLPPDAVQRLKAYLNGGDARLLWPDLQCVSCWRDGASQIFYHVLQQRLPHAKFQAKGILATEGVVTVPDSQDRCILAADSGFFEFLDEQGQCHLAHALLPGHSYEIVMTTAGGLYRYRTGDRVRYAGEINGQIELHFLGRAGLVSDLVGEKLSDDFVAQCLPDDAGFAMLVPILNPAPHYVLLMEEEADERWAASVEQQLMDNPQYAYARRLGQLQPLRLLRVDQPLKRYMQHMAQRGMRLGDIKVSALRPETDWLEAFMG